MATTLEEYWAGLGNRVLEPYPTVSGGTPENTPRQAVARLYQAGIPIDQIAQMTGVAPDIVAMDVAVLSGNRGAFMPETPPVTEDIQGIGIESLYTNTDTPELSEFVDRGNTITDLVNDQVLGGIQTPKPFDYLTEIQTLETLTDMGVDLDDEEATALDEEDDLTKKLIMSSAAGASSNGIDDADAVKTIETMVDISSAFDLNNPDDVKAQLEVYKNAAKLFFDTDDLEKFIPQPDKALPFMVAGAALIQAGSKGDSWGEALSNAFMQYAGTKRKGEAEYEKQILGLKLQERQAINQFAAGLFMADRKEQMALERTLLTKDKMPYKLNNEANPVYFTSLEAAAAAKKGESVIPWTASDGDVKEYTIFTDRDGDGQPDANAPARTELLSELAAQNKQAAGYIIREGNLTKGKKLYLVDNVPAMYSTEELESFMNENPSSNVRVVGPSSAKAVRNRATGELTFVDNRELLTPRGREMYAPIGEESTVIFGPEGNPIIMTGDAAGMGTLMTASQRGKEEARTRKFLIDIDGKRDNLLTTHYTIKNLLKNQRDSGGQIVFGLAGNLTTFGKNVIDQVNQLQTIFTDPESGYALYNDENENGRRDPGETSRNFDGFSKQFEDQIAGTNLGNFLQKAGLGKKRLNNMVLSLALQSAANDGQKGRDISDKDIERFLSRAGAYATSEQEFITVIDDLALGSIRKHESLVDSEVRYATRLKLDPESDERMTMIDFLYPNLLEDQANQRPFRDAPYTIGELKQQLIESTAGFSQYSREEIPLRSVTQGTLPTGSDLSGYKNSTLQQVYERYTELGGGTKGVTTEAKNFLDNVRNDLGGADSSDWKAIVSYIMSQQGREE